MTDIIIVTLNLKSFKYMEFYESKCSLLEALEGNKYYIM